MMFAQGCPVPWRVFVARDLPHTERQACAAFPGFTAVVAAPPIAGSCSNMAGELWHRGPDGVGLYLDGRFGMANNRLAIVDLEGGDQPLERRARPLLGDAERRDLQLRRAARRARAARPPVRDDVRHRGDRARLRGVGRRAASTASTATSRSRSGTAQTAELLLARDRFGVRPLFLAEYDGDVCFASEAKALLRHPAARRELDPVGIVGHVHRLDDAPGPLGASPGSASCRRRTTS